MVETSENHDGHTVLAVTSMLTHSQTQIEWQSGGSGPLGRHLPPTRDEHLWGESGGCVVRTLARGTRLDVVVFDPPLSLWRQNGLRLPQDSAQENNAGAVMGVVKLSSVCAYDMGWSGVPRVVANGSVVALRGSQGFVLLNWMRPRTTRPTSGSSSGSSSGFSSGSSSLALQFETGEEEAVTTVARQGESSLQITKRLVDPERMVMAFPQVATLINSRRVVGSAWRVDAVSRDNVVYVSVAIDALSSAPTTRHRRVQVAVAVEIALPHDSMRSSMHVPVHTPTLRLTEVSPCFTSFGPITSLLDTHLPRPPPQPTQWHPL